MDGKVNEWMNHKHYHLHHHYYQHHNYYNHHYQHYHHDYHHRHHNYHYHHYHHHTISYDENGFDRYSCSDKEGIHGTSMTITCDYTLLAEEELSITYNYDDG